MEAIQQEVTFTGSVTTMNDSYYGYNCQKVHKAPYTTNEPSLFTLLLLGSIRGLYNESNCNKQRHTTYTHISPPSCVFTPRIMTSIISIRRRASVHTYDKHIALVGASRREQKQSSIVQNCVKLYDSGLSLDFKGSSVEQQTPQFRCDKKHQYKWEKDLFWKKKTVWSS